jgi:hypothetical protein
MRISAGRTKLILSVPMSIMNDLYFVATQTGQSMSRVVMDALKLTIKNLKIPTAANDN